MKAQEENLDVLLEQKSDLECALENVKDKLTYIYSDSGGGYQMEIIDSATVLIRAGCHNIPIVINISSFVFEQMIEFYQKLKPKSIEETKEEK